MKIALGADSYGLVLKESIKKYLIGQNYKIKDHGVNEASDNTPYYDTADVVSRSVSNGQYDRAILVCGTGMGMSIISNKHPGIYAAVCESTFVAEKSRSINNSNILTLGSMVTTEDVAKNIVDVWLRTEFTEGWDPLIQEWLKNSMGDIHSLENRQFINK